MRDQTANLKEEIRDDEEQLAKYNVHLTELKEVHAYLTFHEHVDAV
jgi:hypothetical protein